MTTHNDDRLNQSLKTKSQVELVNSSKNPSAYLIEAIKESERDLQAGKIHKFTDIKNAKAFLNK